VPLFTSCSAVFAGQDEGTHSHRWHEREAISCFALASCLSFNEQKAYAPPAMDKELAQQLLDAPEKARRLDRIDFSSIACVLCFRCQFMAILQAQLCAGKISTEDMLKKQTVELPNNTTLNVKKVSSIGWCCSSSEGF
jgi:hypothetical protein